MGYYTGYQGSCTRHQGYYTGSPSCFSSLVYITGLGSRGCPPFFSIKAGWPQMGQNSLEMEIFKSGPRPLGRVNRTFLRHFGPVLTRFRPFPAVLAHFSPEASLGGSHLHGTRPTRLNSLRDGPRPSRGPPGALHSEFRQGCLSILVYGTALTANRHRPSTDNHQPPPTSINRQSTTRPDWPKNGRK